MTIFHKNFLYPFVLLCFFLSIFTPAHATLHSSINRYKSTSVSPKQAKKLDRYDHLIRYFCNFSYFIPNHKVSPDFIRALILAESDANHKAISRKMAFGLGQILFSTAREAALKLAQSNTQFRYVSKEKLYNLQEQDLFDPAINILLTCYLVAKYNYKFSGKLDLVVTAWNAGENTASLSIGRHAPYRETENLIGKINAYFVYLLRNKTFR